MFLCRLVAFLSLCLAAYGQTLPVEYATFQSQGKPVSCVVYDAQKPVATIILLRGSGPADVDSPRTQAKFFAEHGFRVLVADYLSVTAKPNLSSPTIAPGPRWLTILSKS